MLRVACSQNLEAVCVLRSENVLPKWNTCAHKDIRSLFEGRLQNKDCGCDVTVMTVSNIAACVVWMK